jgi:hypothetical protein
MSRFAALLATACCVAALSACAQNRTTEGSAPINADNCCAEKSACADKSACSGEKASSCSDKTAAKKACCSEGKAQ